jgi:hypothetical protein
MAETDQQLAALKPNEEVTRAVQDPIPQILATVLSGYAERPALGFRTYEIVADDERGDRVRRYLPAYSTITYGLLAGQIEAIANFWKHAPKHIVSPGEMVAFIAFNGAEMTAIDLARAHIDWAVSRLVKGELSKAEASAAKLWHTEMQDRVIDAVLNEYIVARLWKDARVTRIYGGTSEIMKEVVARSL